MAEAWLAGASAALDEMEADPSLTLVSSPAFVDMARRLKILAPRGAQFRGGDAPQLDPEKRAKLQEQKMRLLGEIVLAVHLQRKVLMSGYEQDATRPTD